MEEQHILEENEFLPEHASPNARFADFIVDGIGYYIIRFSIFYTVFLSMGSPSLISLYVFAYTVYFCYYTLMEGATGGKTPGKYITGTRAVKEDGSPISFSDAVIRSLCRIIPFEPLSMLGGQPWHDKWTKTIVIKERR